ncbi:torso-like protein [Folsomia candida]|uniref:Torso-like protein n=1 Tax=Folsomia candida TaxID=158441 RepID=A0A226DA12_FOLCA|nr:torso-like protein [Folsomia candida]OXA41718.1 Torso-like protein [Folsomia candida]
MLDNNLPSSKSGLEAEIKWYNLGRHRQSSVCDVVHKSVRHNNSSLSNVTSQKKVVWVFPNRKLILTLALVLNYLCSSGIVLVSGAPSAPMINAIHNRVPVGAIVHLFPRYGYLSLSMRVVPRNDSQSWVFLEPVRNIFLESTIQIEERRFSAIDSTLPIHNEFHIDLCEDMGQLVQAYFRRFYIQGLDKPWQAFSGGWRTPSLSKYFGIDPNFVVGDYRYMLVRVFLVRNSGKATPLANITVNQGVMNDVLNYGNEGEKSMYNFSNTVGTHYVHSYLAGNAIYQVFVYDAAGFEAVKRRLTEYNQQQKFQASILSQLPSILPLWGRQIGKLFVLNSSPQVAAETAQALLLETFQGVTVPNIFKLHDNPSLVRQVEVLLKNEPNGLLGIELKTLDIIFKERKKKRHFVQSLKMLLQLWEVNFQ